MIRPAEERDVGRVCEIYNHYVRETIITFETEPVSDAEMLERVREVSKCYPWLVIEDAGRVAGYAYAGRWQERAAYSRTLETTVYLDPECHGRRLGTRIYEELISLLRVHLAPHVLIAGISLPNAGSIALHEKLGFEKAAHYKEVGRKFDRWIDVGYWQLRM